MWRRDEMEAMAFIAIAAAMLVVAFWMAGLTVVDLPLARIIPSQRASLISIDRVVRNTTALLTRRSTRPVIANGAIAVVRYGLVATVRLI